MRRKSYLQKKDTVDKQLLILSLSFTIIGLIAIADASAPLAVSQFSDKFFFVKQQGLWAFLGVLLFFIFAKIKYTFWERIATPLFFISTLMLILVLVPAVGSRFLGARRWIIVGTLSFQPSEFLKLALAIYIAKVASKEKRLLSFFLPITFAAFLVMLQPDLGTTLVIVGASLTQLFVSGVSLSKFFISIFSGFIVGIVLILSSPYRRARLLTFFEQTKDPLGGAYHIRQILLALGSGGIIGVGLGQSRQKYLFLPETATDSIFAVIAEEVGFIGTAILVCLFAYFVFRGLKISQEAPDRFAKVLSVGIVSWIGGQALLNVASMLALVPLTGVPLPFLSYGGSSLTAVLTACGILLNISRYGKER